MYDLAVRNGLVYIDGQWSKQHVYIRKDKIVEVSTMNHHADREYDVSGKWVMPGFIDPHVHFALNVGQYTSADDFYSGSVSAAFGGITTYIDFLDPVGHAKDVEEALRKRLALAKNSVVDYQFHTTLMNPKGQVEDIVSEMKRLGLTTVKIFTTYSDSGRRTYNDEIIELLKQSESEGITVLAHIEKDELIVLNSEFMASDLSKNSRPEPSETIAALEMAELVKNYGGKLYMVHCSSGNTLAQLIENYRELLGEKMFIESCPHYFTLTNDLLEKEKGYLYTLAPPIRNDEAVKVLNGNIDYVNSIGTDHCPFMLDEKKDKPLNNMPLGIGGVEHSFNVMYSLFGEKAIEKMSLNPAKIFGLYPKKGVIQEGADADIVIYDPNDAHLIQKDHSACDYSVYNGMEVKGSVVSTISRGNFVIKDKNYVLGHHGRYIGGKGGYR